MQKLQRAALLIGLSGLIAVALGDPKPPLDATPVDRPLAALPYRPGLDIDAMDRSADACTDFYQYTCGGWIKNNPIPVDQAHWSVYGRLAKDNQQFLWGILDGLSTGGGERTQAQQQIGDLFAACMDEATAEKRAATPLRAQLDAIAAMKSKRDLPAVLADLHLRTSSGDFLFGFGSDQDLEDSSNVIAFAVAGGLGLPDRDYYTEQDDHSRDIRVKYEAHVARMLALLGDGPELAKHEAAIILAIERALAAATLTRVELRDPHNLFHKMTPQALRAMTPGFDWRAYARRLGVGELATFNVTEPKFYRALDRQLRVNSLANLQTYLRWHLVRNFAPYLSAAFVEENFNFYSKTLRGVPQLRPRWQRCVALVDEQLGEALGQEFVRRTFSPELKQRTLHMTQQIEAAMEDDIKGLNWMSPDTKHEALEKLHAIVNKIGYPDRWRDYSSVLVKRDDLAGDVERATVFESRRRLAKIGKPVDRGEWGMTPPTVNAYYNAQMNDINFPAGVLQPPLFDPRMDDAPNYGNTGGTIGHELTHGFDDEGRQFDARGNLRDWWTHGDARAFTDRAQCVVDQYAKYTIVDDLKIKSKLTEGEDIADLGGLILAWVAWKAETAVAPPPSRDGFTPEQRFFIGYAQWACESARPEQLRVEAITNPHSPGKYRVNGLIVNMPEFATAFACKAGQPMVREPVCRIW